MKSLFATASLCALLAAAPAVAQTTAQTTSGNVSQQDRTFIQNASNAGQAEIQLGKLAQQKAASPAVREFGRWMEADHTFADNQLKGILNEEHINAPQTQQSAQDKELHQRLQNANGAQFDQEYMQAQVKDHEHVINLFQNEASNGDNPILKQFAHNLVPLLQQHLAEAKDLANSNGGVATTGSTAPPRSSTSTPR
ncbi:MAG TPA: DUF4142 domain-containing protein [Stellaceae bacterium]|nr:DUF4142 domain-containing protein [Stellaceae bacterium]